MKLMRLLTILLTLQFALITNHAQSTAGLPNESLRGLKSIVVIIDEVSTFSRPVDSASDTPDPAAVKAYVEARLRKAGFTVVGAGEIAQKQNVPSLHVTLKAQKDSSGFNYFSLRIQLFQEVVLQRNPQATIQAATWEAGSAGHGAGGKLFDRVICQGVSAFIWATNKINAHGHKESRPAIEEIMCLHP